MKLIKVLFLFMFCSACGNYFSQADNWVEDVAQGSPFNTTYISPVDGNTYTFSIRTYYNARFNNQTISCYGETD